MKNEFIMRNDNEKYLVEIGEPATSIEFTEEKLPHA